MEAFEDIKISTKKDIIIDGLMKSNGVYLIVSQHKVGKSLFALQLANSIANGKPFMGHEVLKPSPVLYVTTEMRNSQIKQRCMLLDINFNKKNFFAIDCGESMSVNFMDIEYQVREFAEDYNGKVLILDMLKDIDFGVSYDINSYQDVAQKLMPKIRTYANKYNLSIVLVHHMNKSGKTLGSTGFDAVVDGIIKLNKSTYDTSTIKMETDSRYFPSICDYLNMDKNGVLTISPDGFDDVVNPNLVHLIKTVIDRKIFDTTIGELLEDPKLICTPTQLGKLIHNNRALLANEGVTYNEFRTSKGRTYHFEYHDPSLAEND